MSAKGLNYISKERFALVHGKTKTRFVDTQPKFMSTIWSYWDDGTDKHLFCFQKDGFTLPCQLIRPHAVDVFCAVCRRKLFNFSDKKAKFVVYLFLRRDLFACTEDGAKRIERVRFPAETKDGAIDFFLIEQVVEEAGSVAHGDGKNAARHGIECAHVPAGDAREPLDLAHHRRAGNARRLVEVDKSAGLLHRMPFLFRAFQSCKCCLMV